MTFSNEKSWIFKIRWDFNALPEFTPLSYIKQVQKEKETWQKKLFQDTVREVLTECSHSSFIPQIFNWFTYFYTWSTVLGAWWCLCIPPLTGVIPASFRCWHVSLIPHHIFTYLAPLPTNTKSRIIWTSGIGYHCHCFF